MRPTAAFISGMATMGVLASGIAVGTGVTSSGTADQNSAAAADPTSQTRSSTPTSTVKDGTYTGDTVQTPYGPMQVQITISGGKITDATTLQHPGGDRTSEQINAQVVPILIKATTDYQTVNFGNVSRATITTNSYKQSAQSALDQAGFTG